MRNVLLGLMLLAAACGTNDGAFVVDEPTPTLFDDDEVIVADAVTTTAPRAALEQLAAATLPEPRVGTTGVVVVDGIALAVDERVDTTWFARSPCGVVLSGATSPRRALVVVDPAGDARVEAHGVAITELNHAIASAVAAELERAGVTTLVTRGGTDDVAASVRSEAASASGAFVVVSIAVGAGDAGVGDRPPLELVHAAADDDGRRLAGLIHRSLAPVLTDLPVDWAEGEAGVRSVLNQRGTDFFTMLRHRDEAARAVVHLPALTADASEELAAPGTIAGMAVAVADAIGSFLVTDAEGDGFVDPPGVVRSAATVAADACVDPLVVESEDDPAG